LFLRPFSIAREMRAVPADESHDVIHGERSRAFRTRALGDGRLPLAAALGHLLRGEMSLVGPRPRRAADVTGDEELRVLFDLARPGITGSWRAFSSHELRREEEISLALSALQNQSLLGDLKILLKTMKRPRSTPKASRRIP
jgi:lipopolysaccharide/colanic/teichoic acid biosynthesis glycosyltransferase